MSVVIIGGNECMVSEYCSLCAAYGCRAKLFLKRHKDLQHCFGCPELCVLFTSTVSHTMVKIACDTAKKRKVPLARSHTSSLAALDSVLSDHFGKKASLRYHQ
ncbi:MAG: DUF2325 domain-containing protein [Clostridia bacterium]|nr:DUF2325 domain-containing protein [Clostridia bacterium]